MNFFEILLHPILYIITIIVPLGYGLFVHNIFFKSKKSVFFEIGSLGFLGFSFILLISLFFHFFIPLTDYFCLFILSLGLLLFFFNISIFAIIFTKYYLLALIVLYPLSIIFYPNEDFNHYYLPYLTYIQSSKIVPPIATPFQRSEMCKLAFTDNDIDLVDYAINISSPS